MTSGQRAVDSAGKTILAITGAATVRPAIYKMIMGVSGTPADNALTWAAQRSTAAGTSTAVTPRPLDTGDPASITASGQNHSGEPTYTSGILLFYMALNQRATYTWQALDAIDMLKVPATASNGIGLYPTHASFTGNSDACIYFEE